MHQHLWTADQLTELRRLADLAQERETGPCARYDDSVVPLELAIASALARRVLQPHEVQVPLGETMELLAGFCRVAPLR